MDKLTPVIGFDHSFWNRPVWKSLIFIATGLLAFGWLLITPPGILGKADAVAYAVCHRIDVRSFHIGVRQLPLCARCTGMYLGAMLGLVYQAAFRPRRAGTPGWRVIAFFILWVGAFGVDGVNSYLHLFPGMPSLYEPQNWLRLITGTGMGLAISAAVYIAFNQTVWKDYDPRPALDSAPLLAGLVVLAAVIDLLVLTEIPAILYPLALISAAGVIILLMMIYAMIWLMLFRYENRYERLSQMLMPLTGGFFVGLLQVAALDLIRFWLTGTWSGFHIG